MLDWSLVSGVTIVRSGRAGRYNQRLLAPGSRPESQVWRMTSLLCNVAALIVENLREIVNTKRRGSRTHVRTTHMSLSTNQLPSA